MQEEIKKHQKIQTFGNEVKIRVDEAVSQRKTPEELKEDIANMCVKCLIPITEDCDLCNGHTMGEIEKNFNS